MTYWPTEQGLALTNGESSDMPVLITPLVKDIRVVLVNATLLAQIYRDAECPDAALEDALARIGQQVARAESSTRRYPNGAA